MRQFISRLVATVAAVAVLATGAVATAQGSPFRLLGGDTHTFTAMVYEGVPVRIEVDGDGDSRADLDLYVYNRYGRLVAVDNDNTDFCIGRWTPNFTGLVTIHVRNVGWVYNDYFIRLWGGSFR
jgi:hypothetical protein